MIITQITSKNGGKIKGDIIQPKTIICGNLEIVEEKRDEVQSVRDGLMSSEKGLGNYKITEKDLYGFHSLLKTGYSRKINTDTLIYQEIKSKNEDECDYEKKEYQSIYLNTILLLTSLLNDLDASKHDEIAKQFIYNGIYKVAPIEKIWESCSKKMTDFNSEINRATKLRDLKAFRAALKIGYIRYNIIDQIEPSDSRFQDFYKNIAATNINAISINNALILGDKQHLIKKHKKN